MRGNGRFSTRFGHKVILQLGVSLLGKITRLQNWKYARNAGYAEPFSHSIMRCTSCRVELRF